MNNRSSIIKKRADAPIQPNARPGDFIWADLNGDGKITSGDLDKTFLGSNIPKYTFGFTINMEYEGFDFMLFAQGVAGNKIFQGLRRLDILTSNYPAKAMSRWTGEGTSNDYPKVERVLILTAISATCLISILKMATICALKLYN